MKGGENIYEYIVRFFQSSAPFTFGRTDIFAEQAMPATDEASEMNVEICYTNFMISNDFD
jgi:hypothetical protein